jgi:hypothetical protein
MAQLPLKAFRDLAIDEIRHIVDVMREADDEENEELNNDSTIKRAPKSKKEGQQTLIDDNDIDTNNNTLKRMSNSENNESNGIPSVPRVHMGAGFMKIFNQCPLEIHASYCWMNNDTKGMNILNSNISYCL